MSFQLLEIVVVGRILLYGIGIISIQYISAYM